MKKAKTLSKIFLNYEVRKVMKFELECIYPRLQFQVMKIEAEFKEYGLFHL